MQLLIIKTSSFGDIIQSFDLLVYVKKKFPDAIIDWVVEEKCLDLVSAHPLIDHVYQISGKNLRKGIVSFFKELYSFRKRVKKYDVVFDLQGNTKSSLYLMLVSAKKKVGFSRKTVSEIINIFFTNYKVSPSKELNVRQEYLFFGQSFFQDFFSPLPSVLSYPLSFDEKKQLNELTLPESYVVLAPFSRWPNKELDSSLLPAFIHQHIDCKVTVVILSKGEDEKRRADAIAQLIDRETRVIEGLSIPILAKVLEQARKAICMDSMILHLAAAVGCSTVSFFSASSGKKYAPIGNKHLVFQGLCPYNKTFNKRCRVLRTCEGPCCLSLQKKL